MVIGHCAVRAASVYAYKSDRCVSENVLYAFLRVRPDDFLDVDGKFGSSVNGGWRSVDGGG